MYRCTIIVATNVLLAILGWPVRVASQGFEADSVFTWKLVETANLGTQSTIQFIPRAGISPVSWDFGDGTPSTQASPTHTYTYASWDDSIKVTLTFTENGENKVHSRDIPLSPAYFHIRPDRNLGRLASYKRIFLNAYFFENNPDDLGNLRFSWTVDGRPLPGSQFETAALGQWPNIYYTFTAAGPHQVKLEVRNSNSGQTAEFTHTLVIQPDFSAGKVKLENIPNVFTPNGDGVNDDFIIPSSGTARFDIRIFSRSGGLIYKAESSIIRWDGKNTMGTDMPEGIYYYVVEDLWGLYESAKGFVYLFRGKK